MHINLAFQQFSRVLFPLINPITATRLTTIIRPIKIYMMTREDVSSGYNAGLLDAAEILELAAIQCFLRL
jgi:hypothetical protein